jgi:drug/metabolite transporter (DMT)-like permease
LFALADVLVQKWVTAQSFPRFVPVMCGAIAVMSLVLVPFFRESLWAIPKPIWWYLVWGSCVLAGQALLMLFVLSRYGHATAVNILYSTRGIWSVLLVWILGHWMATHEEQAAGHKTMALRLVGASVLLVAVILVMI